MSQTDAATRLDAIRQAWRDANVTPLWETTAHRPADTTPRAYHWKWRVLRPLIDQAIEVTGMENAERRVLALTNPDAIGGRNTTTNLNGYLQVLMPGESRVRPHRHTPNALRFVLEGGGATTEVDGKRCPMAEGDLIITPGMSWHAHSHAGSAPIVWFDALDVPLHQYLGTAVFEPGPPKNLPEPTDDAAFAVPNIVPELQAPASYSPVFRYPWAASVAALAAAPLARDGARKIRYVNPMTGGSVMALLDCSMTRIAAGTETIPYRTTSNAVGVVVEGTGTSRVGNETFAWQPKDIFSMPHGNWISHSCDSGSATLFVVSDREVLRRLDLLIEEYGNAQTL